MHHVTSGMIPRWRPNRMDEPFPLPLHIRERLREVVVTGERTFPWFTYLILLSPTETGASLYSDPVEHQHFILMCCGERKDNGALMARAIPRVGSPWEHVGDGFSYGDNEMVEYPPGHYRTGQPMQNVVGSHKANPHVFGAITEQDLIDELIPERYRR